MGQIHVQETKIFEEFGNIWGESHLSHGRAICTKSDSHLRNCLIMLGPKFQLSFNSSFTPNQIAKRKGTITCNLDTSFKF